MHQRVAGIALLFWARPIKRQIWHVDRVLEFFDPIVERFLLRGLVDHLGLCVSGERRRWDQGRGLPVRRRVIKRCQIIQQNAKGPAISNDVMRGQDQNMLIRA